MSAIDARRAGEAAELDARCFRAWRKAGSYTDAARRLGVTSKFLRAAVERAEAAGMRAEAAGMRAEDSPTVRVYKPAAVEPDVFASPAEERSWLAMVAQGAELRDVAELAGVTVERVRIGLGRARDAGVAWWEARRAWNPTVAILIPQDYRPSSPCPHDGPIARGRRAYCAVCHASGLDHEPGMQVDPKTAPKPEPRAAEPAKPRAPKQREAPKAETPKQRKARERAEALERLRWLL